MNAVIRVCALCGRVGSRQMRPANTGEGRTGEDWVCSNDRACRSRRATARGPVAHMVVFFPDATLNVAAVGPFRSARAAEETRDRLELALDPPDGDEEYEFAYRRPQVVTCMTEADAVAEYGLNTGGGGDA